MSVTDEKQLVAREQLDALVERAELRAVWSEELEQAGKVEAKINPRLAKFALMLSHPEFAEFFDQNFASWSDCQQAIMLLKTGAYLKAEIQKTTGEFVTGNQLVAALRQVMSDPDQRHYMVKSLTRFMDGEEAPEFVSEVNRLKTMEPPLIQDASTTSKFADLEIVHHE